MTQPKPFCPSMPIPGHAQPSSPAVTELSALELALTRNDPDSQHIVAQSAQRLIVLTQQIRHAQAQGVAREQFELLQAMLQTCLAAQQVLAKHNLSGQASHLSGAFASETDSYLNHRS